MIFTPLRAANPGALVFATALATTMAGCSGPGGQAPGKAVCASQETAVGVKTALFSKARGLGPGAESRISELETGSIASLEQPVLDQVDTATEKTVCSATLVLSLPPGSKAQKGLDEDQKLRIRYSIQPAADGNGMVYELFGGEDLAARLAGKRAAAAKPAQAAQTAAAGSPAKGGHYYITGLNPNGDNWLALKAEPNLQSARLAKLGPDTLLISDGTTVGQWLKVETLDGQSGWVASRYTACCR